MNPGARGALLLPLRSFSKSGVWQRVLEACRPGAGVTAAGPCEAMRVPGYPHDGGWMTNDGRMWLFIHCPECGDEMAKGT
ncbi:MAG: hypothetical protein MUC66_08745 [Methanolinea sp.]|nr:hypothetical protein [Methanolinea sp.]